jgi:perosamine synthetase
VGDLVIPVNEPALGERELELVADCVRSGWVSSAGRYLDEFERSWAEYCGMKHGVAVSSGTAALDVAVSCLNLEPGDEVILPSFTIISCAQAITKHGGTPVLVDCDPQTWCLDVDQVAARVSSRTRAVMPVHMYGHPADMDPLRELADHHGLALIEDAAQAHGARYKDRRCGGLGDISCFSFYANKIITTGEGGMVLTDSDEWTAHARAYRNLCFRADRRFYHEELGENYRMTNLQAALGVAQLERHEETLAHKRRMAAEYDDRLKDVPGLQLPTEREWAQSNAWMYAVVVDEGTGYSGEGFSAGLKERGVDSRPFFLGMHEQPAFHRMGLFVGEHYPVTERISRQGVYLPSGAALDPSQVQLVCTAVREVLA